MRSESSLHPRTIARQAALRALVAMEHDEAVAGAAARNLHAAADQRGFAHELTYGVLRHRSRVDLALRPLLKKPIDRLDAPVRAALRLAAYERYHLGAEPAVVVNEYASLMRLEKKSSATGFVNAVLRRLPRQISTVALSHDLAANLANACSHPQWLVERWINRFGLDGCRALCEINNRSAPLTLRVNTLRTDRETVLSALICRGLKAKPGALAPDAILVEDAGSPTDWPEWRDGEIIAQDEAAQIVAYLADPQPGQFIIDAAAAPGGKATHLAQLMKNDGILLAQDVAPGRVKLIEQNAQRLGLSIIEPRVADLHQTNDRLLRNVSRVDADIVLLDVPCLGTGTWRRRPDARWRKSPAQLEELVKLQREMLEAAATLVRPGGVLVYSTCSLEREENEEQVRWWLDRHNDWRIEAPPLLFHRDALQRTVTAEGFVSTLPHRDGCDGMFAVRLRRGEQIAVAS